MIVQHVKILGLVTLVWALLVMPGQAAQPSFDCAEAEDATEKLVCDDGQLAAMDVELARLYELAQATPEMDAHDKEELTAGELAWIDTRDDCAKAGDPRACVEAAYASRIAALRETYADTRTEDDKGISLGPFDVACPGMGATGTLIFVNADPSVAYLAWPGRTYILTQTMSGSGARYAAKLEDGEVVFWNKGNDASLQIPGHDDTTCSIAKPG
jgi:uncharacterized protein